ncbi:MAG: hypothetical protein HYT87_18265 [Nitrospirae bacterium]|nr:hypothetical protein [Nitrospirota bacterium]
MPEQLSTFHIMAVLQYARALKLGMPDTDAKSWAANRALNFALFKNGAIIKNAPLWKDLEADVPGEIPAPDVPKLLAEGIADEKVPFQASDKGRMFVFGGKPVPASYFDKEVIGLFGPSWEKVMGIAKAHCEKFSKQLTSKLDFFLQVFKPVSNDWLRQLRSNVTSKAPAQPGWRV